MFMDDLNKLVLSQVKNAACHNVANWYKTAMEHAR